MVCVHWSSRHEEWSLISRTCPALQGDFPHGWTAAMTLGGTPHVSQKHSQQWLPWTHTPAPTAPSTTIYTLYNCIVIRVGMYYISIMNGILIYGMHELYTYRFSYVHVVCVHVCVCVWVHVCVCVCECTCGYVCVCAFAWVHVQLIFTYVPLHTPSRCHLFESSHPQQQHTLLKGLLWVNTHNTPVGQRIWGPHLSCFVCLPSFLL